jgi:hypothetical protein
VVKRADLINLLAAHADTLNAGGDDALLLNYGEARSVGPLLLLARSVKEALVPLRPRDTFRHELAYQLLAADLAFNPHWHAGLWRRLALLGSVLSVAGVLLLFLRYNRTWSLDSPRRL